MQKFLIGVALVLGGLGTILACAALMQHMSQKTVGATEPNSYWYSGGLAWGNVDLTHSTQQITIPAGSNQITWFPNVGRDIVVDQIDLSMTGTASSSFQVNVGTTTTSSNIPDVFSNVTAPFWAQAISSFQVATGTTAQTGASADFLTTMGVTNKTGYPDELQVPPNYGVRLMVNSFCTVDGACNTATSSARGWGTMTATLFYHYKGSD